MSYRIIVGLLFIATNIVYAQCDYSSELPCNSNEDCEWIEDIEYGSCSNLSHTQCNSGDYGSCEWECIEYGWWYDWCYTSACTGGTYEIDNGSCEEIEMPDCSELEQASCNHPLYGEGCEWVGSDVDCEILYTESSCDSSDCEWVEDISQGNCYYAFSSYSECVANGCSWYNPGTYGYMGSHCYGGTYTIDNSYCNGEAGYCDEIQYHSGDINGDSSVNILDVIQTIDLVLMGEYNYIVDMDSNDSINILDIIILVELIVSM